MGFSKVWRSLPNLLLVMFSANVSGQDAVPVARTVLDLSQSEQIAFINRTLDLGLPEDRADQMTMLIINRSAVTLPLIEARLEQAVKSPSTSKSFIDTAIEMVAYSGDDEAIRAAGKLLALDEKRFGSLVGRTLDNAGNWRNPFTVAYRGLEIGDEAVSRRIAAWAESALASAHMQRAWAESLVDRYGKVPGESEWAKDPLFSRLKDRPSLDLRQSVARLAPDAQRKRQQQ